MQALIVYSLASAVGQNFIYYTITQFNPLVLTTITTTRKVAPALAHPTMRHPSPHATQAHVCARPALPTTTVRPGSLQIFTTVYSVFRNPANRLNEMQWAGCGCVFVGMLLDIAASAFTKKKEPPKPAPATEMSAFTVEEDEDDDGGDEERPMLSKS